MKRTKSGYRHASKLRHCLGWFLLCLSTARADQYVFVQGGFTSPTNQINSPFTNNSESIGNGGPSGGAQYLYEPATHRWGLGVDALYHSFGSVSSTNLFPDDIGSKTSLNTLTVLAIGRLNFHTQLNITPYILGGMGIARNNFNWQATPPPGAVWNDTENADARSLVDTTETAFAGALGFGVDHPLSDVWILGAEVRYTWTGNVTYPSTSFGQNAFGLQNASGSTGILSWNILLGYRFGPAHGAAESPLQASMGTNETTPTATTVAPSTVPSSTGVPLTVVPPAPVNSAPSLDDIGKAPN